MERPSAAGQPFDGDELYDDAPCGLLVTAADGVIEKVNRTFCAWVGREPSELVGCAKLQDLLTMGGRIFHQTHWAPLLQIQGSVAEVKLEVVHRDGHKLPTVWNAIRRRRGERTVHEVAVFIAEDRHKYEQELVLARRRAEELLAKEQEAQIALRATQEERDRQRALAEERALFAEQMMAIVSHDLRNPLSVIRICSHILSLSELSVRQRAALARLNNSTQRAIRLISDLLDFKRGQSGAGLQVEVQGIDFHAVVADALEELRIGAPERSIAHRRLGTGPCLGSADRLTQLIGNLVTNAITHGAAGSPILVTSIIDEKGYSVSVHNDGAPIPQALLPRLFDPMTRGASAAGSASSIGLGLFIVREIARAHGGAVEVASSSQGGTTFTASFPMAAPGRQTPATRPANGLAEVGRQPRADTAEVDRLAVSELPEAAYDDIVRLAAETCDVPIALVTLVDGGRHWVKARFGLQGSATQPELDFCAQAILAPAELLVVEDAASDPRHAANPLVTGDPGIRFYAGAPLLTSTGTAVGTVSVMDREPRTLDARQLALLRFLALQVVDKLEHLEPETDAASPRAPLRGPRPSP